MQHKRISLLILSICFIFLGFLVVRSLGWANHSKEPSKPQPNIDIQTKVVKGVTFELRNAYYTKDEIKVGYEIKGITLIKDYNIVCKFYSNKTKITSGNTSGGGLANLADKNYYLTGIEDVRNYGLPDPLSLTVEITALPVDSRLNPVSVSFDLSLTRERN